MLKSLLTSSRKNFEYASKEFANLLYKHQDIVATLKEAYIPFEKFKGPERDVFRQINTLFNEEDIACIRQVAQLVYIAGKDLKWLRVEKTHLRAKYCFYEPGDMISTINFDGPTALENLFNYTKLKRAIYHIQDSTIPSVAHNILTDDDNWTLTPL